MRKTHTGIWETKCQERGKTFNPEDGLIAHVRVHSGEKPYPCDICRAAFSRSRSPTIHKRSYTGEKLYHCGLCGKPFHASSKLKLHTRYHSGERPRLCGFFIFFFAVDGLHGNQRWRVRGTSIEKPFACCICGARYRFATSLKVHMQTHEGAKTER